MKDVDPIGNRTDFVMSNMDNCGGSDVNLVSLDENKAVYGQPPVVSPATSLSTNEPLFEPVNSTTSSFSVAKVGGAGSLSQNGKIVHVQSANPNSVYIGTLLRQSSKGNEVIPQKVLLATVKTKDSPQMARFILPRPSTNSQQSPTAPKQIRRSFNMIPCSQGTIMPSAITVRTSEGNKLLQPNIIRQRTMDGKLISSGSAISISGSIIVPGKSPAPALALIGKSVMSQGVDKHPKIMVLDLKDKDKCLSESVDATQPGGSNSASKKIVDDKISVPSDSDVKPDVPEVSVTTPKKQNDSQVDPQLVIEDKKESPDNDTPNNVEKPLSPKNPRCRPLDASIPPSSASQTGSVPSSQGKTPTLQKPIPPLSPRDSQPKETVPPTEGRARKRKGSLNMAVSSPSKTRPVVDTYENLRILPGAEDLNPFNIIKWDEQGIGALPETDIQVVLNEFGMIELNADEKQLEKNRHGKIDDAEEIFCCVQCHCYGLISEFFNESYCSASCKEELIAQQLSLVNLEDIEPIEDIIEKKKSSDNLNLRKSTMTNEVSKAVNKSSSANKPIPIMDDDDDDEVTLLGIEKIPEEPIPIIELSDSPPPPKKSLSTDSSNSKIKKLLPKSSNSKPTNKQNKSSKSTGSNTPSSQESLNKSKIKLRPRSGGKICKYTHEKYYCNKYSNDKCNTDKVNNELMAQDLGVGQYCSTDKPDYPKKHNGFRWGSYLEQSKGTPVWVKLFSNPYPNKPNRFRVGQRLEAIDPEHQSYFCVVSVAAVKGYRLKLHFDGYPPEYDFWVNADSPSIFPTEFCSGKKIPLQTPPGVPMRSFDWSAYLSRHNYKPAPSTFFDINWTASVPTNLFKADMKLEAVDRKNTYLVCVATVTAVLGNQICIHFDSWGDMYDYWVDITSPYIRPVGWCQNNGHELTPPNGTKPEHFSWKRYLKETKSIAAPEKAFCVRPPIEFKKGMKLEAVDKRSPHLIRVATISKVLPYQVYISFDGFPEHFGYWVDDDSPDIHPVGWASRSGHPLEPPPTEEDLLNAPCKVPGCVGQGYLKGTKFENHKKFEDCPYATEHLTKDTALTDRLKWGNVKYKKYGDDFCTVPDDSDDESDEDIESIRWSWLKVQQDLKKSSKRIPEEINRLSVKPKKMKAAEEPKTDPFNDSMTDSEEIKQIFGPSSPLPFINDDLERPSSIDNTKSKPGKSVEIMSQSKKDVDVQTQDPLDRLEVGLNETVKDSAVNEELEDTVEEVKNEVRQEVEPVDTKKLINGEVGNVEVKKEIKQDSERSELLGETLESLTGVNVEEKVEGEEFVMKINEELKNVIKIFKVEKLKEKLIDKEIGGDDANADLGVEKAEINHSPNNSPSSNPSREREVNDAISIKDKDDVGPIFCRSSPDKNNITTPIASPSEVRQVVEEEVVLFDDENDRHPVKNIFGSDSDEEMEVDEEENLDLEEVNAHKWTIKQVSQFTRRLISNCSKDCFVKEGIDGQGFLLLKKSDLITCYGLSDSDAERVYSKIRMLRECGICRK